MQVFLSQTIYFSAPCLTCPTTIKASSYSMTYINTQVAEHEDDRTLPIHGSKIKDQPSRVLRFQNHILRRQRRSEVEYITALDIRTSKRNHHLTELSFQSKE